MNQLRGTPLKRFLRDFRREHPVTYDLVLVLQSVMYPVNVGSLFRIADATRQGQAAERTCSRHGHQQPGDSVVREALRDLMVQLQQLTIPQLPLSQQMVHLQAIDQRYFSLTLITEPYRTGFR